MSEVLTRNCTICGDSFITADKRKLICPKEHTRNCLLCDTEFTIKKSRDANKKFCQHSCSVEYNRNPDNKKGYECICELCGDIFKGIRRTQRFCKKDHFNNCVVCGKQYLINPFARAKQTCGSKKCGAAIINFEERTRKNQATLKKRYGTLNVSSVPEVKDKKKATLMKNYGVENPSYSDEIKQKREATVMDRYGVHTVLLNPEIKDRIAATNLEKYGAANPFASEEIKEVIKQTNLETYGVENVWQREDIRTKAIANGSRQLSALNRAWQSRIKEELGVEFEFEKRFVEGKGWLADLHYNGVFIDINPSISHNSTQSYLHLTGRCEKFNLGEACDDPKHLPRKNNYHRERAVEAFEQGVTFLQWFDWMDEKIFMSILRSKLHLDENRVYARKTQLKKITQKEANIFLRENHLLGGTTGQQVCYGLFTDDDELIHVQTYGKARWNKNYEWEAIRSCSKMNWHIIGGFTKVDKAFFAEYDPDSMVSYVDLSISTANITESRHGEWTLDKIQKSSPTWCYFGKDKDRPTFLKDSTVQRATADKLIGLEEGVYPGLNNDQVLIAEGYLLVFGPGVLVYGYRKPHSTPPLLF